MSGEQRLDRSVLEGKKADELKAIAAAVGIPLTGRPTKAGVIDQILQFTAPSRSNNGGGGQAKNDERTSMSDDAPTATVERPKRNRSRSKDAASGSDDIQVLPEKTDKSEKAEGASANGDSANGGSSQPAEGGGESGGGGSRSQRDQQRRGFDTYSADGGPGNSRSSRRRRRGRNPSTGGGGGGGGNGNTRERDGGSNYDTRVEQADAQFQGDPIPVTGVLELRDEGFGFIRTRGYLAAQGDVYVPVSQVRKYSLRKGDHIEGESRPAASNEKYPALLSVSKISGLDPDVARQRPKFEELTPLFPDSRLRLETPGDPGNLTARIVDLMSPIGKGQRGLIVSPPKAGKTTVMKHIAHSIEQNNPNVHLMVLLVDERPEEVTDMKRFVKGEVVASTFDRPADEHTKVSELALERAKRLVEQGTDVVIILDGITRLARAYNLAAPASGRILSGGVDSGALYPPKRFFGAARNIEEGGSLTILATALVETGSKMDEVIFEEFKGTGNMELKLDRRLAERRLYPAIDANGSSTRHEELLFERTQLSQVWKLRRVLNALAQDGNTAAGLELLMDKIKTTASNDEFLAEIAKNPMAGN